MLEANGDAWKLAKHNVLCLTTNGFLKKSGECVMGRGIAKEAATRFPHLPLSLGQRIASSGNHVYGLGVYGPPNEHWILVSFPVKHNWWEEADPELIRRSAEELVSLVDQAEYPTVYLPRPGCGNGKLQWEDVKPILEPILDDRFVIVTW